MYPFLPLLTPANSAIYSSLWESSDKNVFSKVKKIKNDHKSNKANGNIRCFAGELNDYDFINALRDWREEKKIFHLETSVSLGFEAGLRNSEKSLQNSTEIKNLFEKHTRGRKKTENFLFLQKSKGRKKKRRTCVCVFWFVGTGPLYMKVMNDCQNHLYEYLVLLMTIRSKAPQDLLGRLIIIIRSKAPKLSNQWFFFLLSLGVEHPIYFYFVFRESTVSLEPQALPENLCFQRNLSSMD